MIMIGKIKFSPECGMAVAERYGSTPAVPDFMSIK
ncbi:MAG: hypothetical protein RL710_1666, partial [Pseudomonadota bacterium]